MTPLALVLLMIGLTILVGAFTSWRWTNHQRQVAPLVISGGMVVIVTIILIATGAGGFTTSESKHEATSISASRGATKIVADASDLLRIRVPSSWRVVARSKNQIQVTAPEYDQNIIASSEPLSVDTSRVYALSQGKLLGREFKGYVERAFGASRIFGNHPGYVREFSWTPNNGPVDQIQIYYVRADRGYVATATRRSAPGAFPLLRALIQRLELDL